MKAVFIRSGLFLSTALYFVSPALAQDVVKTNPPAHEAEADAIIVTARRSEERLQDVPISITVFNQTALTNNNVVHSQDLATYTPSLSANANFGNDNTTFAIRGFVQEIGTAPSVGVYFNDVVTPRGASNGLPTGDGLAPGTLFDLQNVQVLKGPQGTLFGRNTTGGAILVVPQKPTGQLEGYVEGSIGDNDLRRVQAVINVPLSDTFRIRAGLDRMKRDGYIHNVSGVGPKDFGNVNYWSGRLSIVGELAPNLETYTVASYTHSNTNGPLGKLIAADLTQGLGGLFAGGIARQGSNFYNAEQMLEDPYSKLDQWSVINTTTFRASDTLTIKNIVSYAELRQSLNTVGQFGVRAIVGPFELGATSISTPLGIRTANESTFTEELQFQGRTADNKFTWQAGGYFEKANPLGLAGSQAPVFVSCTNLQTFQCINPLGFGVVNYTVGKTSFRDVGLYAQGTYKFSDQFRVTGGFRYTWDHAENVSDQRIYLINPPPVPGLLSPNPICTKPTAPGCISNYSQSSKAPTWLIDFEYSPTQDIMAYAKYARGYRSGAIAANVSPPLDYVEPEKVDTYEIGLKTSFNGAVTGTFNVAAFYNDFRNQQIQLGFSARPGSGQASTAAPVNANKSEIYGVEIDGTLRPFEGLELGASYAYLHTEIKDVPDFSTYNDPNFILQAPFRVGDPEPLSPKHKLTVSATYTLPLDDSVGDISFGAVYSYRSRMLSNYTDRENPNPAIAALSYLPHLGLLNLNMNWRSVMGSPVDLGLFVTNVTEEKYYNYTTGLGSPDLGIETGVVGEPRMYGARLRFRFGG